MHSHFRTLDLMSFLHRTTCHTNLSPVTFASALCPHKRVLTILPKATTFPARLCWPHTILFFIKKKKVLFLFLVGNDPEVKDFAHCSVRVMSHQNNYPCQAEKGGIEKNRAWCWTVGTAIQSTCCSQKTWIWFPAGQLSNSSCG